MASASPPDVGNGCAFPQATFKNLGYDLATSSTTLSTFSGSFAFTSRFGHKTKVAAGQDRNSQGVAVIRFAA